MQRMIEYLFRFRILYHVSQIHNTYRIGDMLYNGQVVGNKKIGQIKFLLQVTEQIDNLCLNGNIQCGYRFVADNEDRV